VFRVIIKNRNDIDFMRELLGDYVIEMKSVGAGIEIVPAKGKLSKLLETLVLKKELIMIWCVKDEKLKLLRFIDQINALQKK
jgi:hypothetical protein